MRSLDSVRVVFYDNCLLLLVVDFLRHFSVHINERQTLQTHHRRERSRSLQIIIHLMDLVNSFQCQKLDSSTQFSFCLTRTFDLILRQQNEEKLEEVFFVIYAQRLIVIFGCLWALHGIPYLVFFQHTLSPVTGKVTCSMVNNTYMPYRIYVVVLVLFGILPLTVTALFGTMAFRNIQQIPHYVVPLVRRELDKQLTVMVLVQVFINVFTLLPYTVVNMLSLNMRHITDPLIQAQIQLSATVTLLVYYVFYAVSMNPSEFLSSQFVSL